MSNKKSGLQIFILNEAKTANSYYSAAIDKLSPDLYSVDSYYIEDNKLNMFMTIDKSFTNGVVSVYNYSTVRQLQSQVPTPTLVGTFEV